MFHNAGQEKMQEGRWLITTVAKGSRLNSAKWKFPHVVYWDSHTAVFFTPNSSKALLHYPTSIFTIETSIANGWNTKTSIQHLFPSFFTDENREETVWERQNEWDESKSMSSSLWDHSHQSLVPTSWPPSLGHQQGSFLFCHQAETCSLFVGREMVGA